MDVISLVIHLRLLVDRRDEEVRPVHELVLCSFTKSVRIRIFKEHGANHRLAVYRFAGNAVSIRHQAGFHFQVPAVDGSCRFA